MQLTLRPYVTAGVALAGASMIVATPVTTPLPDVQLPPIQLTADTGLGAIGDVLGTLDQDVSQAMGGVFSGGLAGLSLPNLDNVPLIGELLTGTATPDAFVNPITTWVDVLTAAGTNLSNLGATFLADPAPILEQFITNQIGYATVIAGAGQTLVTGVADQLSQLPAALQTAFTDFGAGDISKGLLAMWDWFLLTALQAIGPINTIYTGVIDPIVDHFANLVHTFGNELLLAGLGVLQPVFGTFVVAPGEIGDSIAQALSSGDFLTAFSDILNAPATLTGALLNGISVPDIGSATGLLSDPGGTIATLLGIRDALADALATTTVSPTLAGLASDLLAGQTADAIPVDFTAFLNAFDLGGALDVSQFAGLADLTAIPGEIMSALLNIF
ncbi:hypothetical protein ACAG26_24960 [Mycobacterium sp. pUA109]|uniref:hypothetical protein n=1 Tax=Mycobacterium sp. pUA109 TaxID=3238982 RepID=UPI00351AEAE0